MSDMNKDTSMILCINLYSCDFIGLSFGGTVFREGGEYVEFTLVDVIF